MHHEVYGEEIGMSGYDLKVYDPKRLTGDDAKVMEGFELCGQEVLNCLDEMSRNGFKNDSVPLFNELYRQVTRDIRYMVSDILNDAKTELAVSLMEADPERYAAD